MPAEDTDPMYIDLDSPLTGNISWYELTRTSHRSYLEENRRVPLKLERAGRDLAGMLQVIRDHYGKPLILHSGYRCPGLNAAIGGSDTSQHMVFEAADFHVSGVDLTETWEWIWKSSGLTFSQLILEGWSAGKPSWIHIGLGPPYFAKNRSGTVMTWNKAEGYHTVAKVPLS